LLLIKQKYTNAANLQRAAPPQKQPAHSKIGRVAAYGRFGVLPENPPLRNMPSEAQAAFIAAKHSENPKSSLHFPPPHRR
jgi:hypothetical protein